STKRVVLFLKWRLDREIRTKRVVLFLKSDSEDQARIDCNGNVEGNEGLGRVGSERGRKPRIE
ncbi:MAG: hypothetical protein IJL42_03610, partial [Bacteroidales bacterium]|nr:hypothetical protein [Bacteroidales bacterium]